jgi:hypothetical protein
MIRYKQLHVSFLSAISVNVIPIMNIQPLACKFLVMDALQPYSRAHSMVSIAAHNP